MEKDIETLETEQVCTHPEVAEDFIPDYGGEYGWASVCTGHYLVTRCMVCGAIIEDEHDIPNKDMSTVLP